MAGLRKRVQIEGLDENCFQSSDYAVTVICYL